MSVLSPFDVTSEKCYLRVRFLEKATPNCHGRGNHTKRSGAKKSHQPFLTQVFSKPFQVMVGISVEKSGPKSMRFISFFFPGDSVTSRPQDGEADARAHEQGARTPLVPANKGWTHKGSGKQETSPDASLKGCQMSLIFEDATFCAYLNGPYPQYGWDFPERNSGKLPERPRKRSQNFSWNSPREYGWDPPNPIIPGI